MVEARNQTYLIIMLNEQRILLPIDQVLIVLSLPALQSVPDQAPAFKGLLNYHGRGIPIYDLSLLIHGKPLQLTIDTPLILVKMADKEMGFLVSAALDLATPSPDALQTPPQDAKPYVHALYEQEHESAWIIDLEKLTHAES